MAMLVITRLYQLHRHGRRISQVRCHIRSHSSPSQRETSPRRDGWRWSQTVWLKEMVSSFEVTNVFRSILRNGMNTDSLFWAWAFHHEPVMFLLKDQQPFPDLYSQGCRTFFSLLRHHSGLIWLTGVIQLYNIPFLVTWRYPRGRSQYNPYLTKSTINHHNHPQWLARHGWYKHV